MMDKNKKNGRELSGIFHFARLLFCALAVVTAAGCASIIKPNLGPDPCVARTYDSAPTLTNAIAVGTSMRERYTAKVENNIAWERGTGLGLIAGTAVAADLAMRSVGTSEILGLGLAGAAVYTGNNWLFSKPQQMIYAAGANAVQCALEAVLPLRQPSQRHDELQALIVDIDAGIKEIRGLLIPNGATKSQIAAKSAVDRAGVLLPVARESLGVLDGAAGELRSSLSSIQLQVTNAYIANSPNMQGLVESLGKALPAMGSKIIGVSLPDIPQPDMNKGSSTSGDETEKALDKKTENLNAQVTEAAQIVAVISYKLGDDKLKLCNVDLKQAGLSMKLIPGNEVSVQPGTASTVAVSGGVLPYRADWIGTRPPSDQVDLAIETGQGLITITAKNKATAGTYKILVLDAGSGREVVNVAIGSSSSVTQLKAPLQQAAPAADPKIKKLQQALIDKGIKTVSIDGKDETLVADGRNGPITVAAMKLFYTGGDKNIADDAIPEGDKLLKQVSEMLELE